jgi:hypothetical protein
MLRLMQAGVPQLAVGEEIVPTLKRRRFPVADGFSNADAAYRIRRAQSAAELGDVDTRAYMLEQLSLAFVTQQRQHEGREEIQSAFTLPVCMSL